MKSTRKIYFLAIAASILMASLPVLQSCSNDIEPISTEELSKDTKIKKNVKLKDSEIDEIVNSKEFEEYVEATADLAVVLQRLDSTQKDPNTIRNAKRGFSPIGQEYITYPFKMDKKLIDDAKLKKSTLLNKFPTCQNLTNECVLDLMNKALSNESIAKIFRVKGLLKKKSKNLRRKVLDAEGYGTLTFDNISDFYAAATSFTNSKDKECAGFQLANGGYVLYMTPTATATRTEYPPYARTTNEAGDQVSIYQGSGDYSGQEIVGTFHTQTSNFNISTKDINSQQNFPDSPCTILLNGDAYTYNFQNGQVNPKGYETITYEDGRICTITYNSDGTMTIKTTYPDGRTETVTK